MSESVEAQDKSLSFSLLATLSENSMRESTLPSFVTVQASGTFYVGLSKIVIAKEHQAWQLLVRPDVSEDSLLNLAEQILLSSCGVVNRLGPQPNTVFVPSAENKDKHVVYYSSILESIHDSSQVNGSAGPTLWSSIRVYLGVTIDFNRVLFLHITPSADVTTISSVLTSRWSQFTEFCDSVLQALTLALNVESLSLNHLMNEETVVAFENGAVVQSTTDKLLNMSLNDDNSSTVSSNSHNSTIMGERAKYYPAPLAPLESIIDISYVRDLQTSFAQLLLLRLTALGEQLDPEVKNMELQCARLMSLLRPSYTRAVLAIPTAPVAKPLSAYPVALDRKTILEPNEEDCKFMLLKARRRLKQHGTHNLSLAEEINVLIGFIFEQLLEWMELELQRRTDRKIVSIKDRLQSVHQFKMRLVLTLHERFNVSAEDSSQYTFGAFNQDRSLQATVQEKCKFIDGSEPLLLDCTAVLNGRKGTVYFTIGHILFYSMGILASTVLAVIPLHTISFMNVILGGKVVTQLSYLETPESTGKEPNLAAGDGISILDTGGQENLLDLKGLTPDYNKRVADLLDVLIKEKLYLLRNNSPIANNRYSASSSAPAIQHSTVTAASFYDNLYNVDDLLDLIGAPPQPLVPPKATNSVDANPKEQAKLSTENITVPPVIVESTSSTATTTPTIEEPAVFSPSNATTDSTGSTVTGEQPKGKSRSANIKKFLEKSHTQKVVPPPAPDA